MTFRHAPGEGDSHLQATSRIIRSNGYRRQYTYFVQGRTGQGMKWVDMDDSRGNNSLAVGFLRAARYFAPEKEFRILREHVPTGEIHLRVDAKTWEKLG